MTGKKKRVLFVLKDMNIGGVEKSLLSLLDALPGDKYEIDLGLTDLGGGFLPYVPEGVNILRLEPLSERRDVLFDRMGALGATIKKGKLLLAAKMIATYAFSQARKTLLPYYSALVPKGHSKEYDVAVSYQGPSELLDFYVIERVKACKKVAWIHFDVEQFFTRRKSVEMLYPAFDRICVVSEAARNVFCRNFPSVASATRLFPNIVDHALYERMGSEELIEHKSQLNIVTIGRLEVAKGSLNALDAARELARRGVDYTWYIIGGGSLFESLKSSIEIEGLSGNVILTGPLANPYPYLAAADVYVQLSHHEGFGLTIAEALGFGVPVVSSDTTGGRDQLHKVSNSIIVDSLDSDIVADAILRAAKMPHIPTRRATSPSSELISDIF